MNGTDPRSYSYELERNYYSRDWPNKALPYDHLEAYLRCWTDPESIFMGKRVLDIGAGECAYTRLIADKFGPRSIVACELFLQRLLPAEKENQNPILKFVNGDAFNLPFHDKSFEIVFGSLVLCQLPDLGRVIREIGRVLSTNGCYVGIEPNPYNSIHLYRHLVGSHSPNEYLFGPKHLMTFEESGFKVVARYFYAKRPRIRNRFMGTCMGIIAKRSGAI